MALSQFFTDIINFSPENTLFIRAILFVLIFTLINLSVNKLPQFNKNKVISLIISLTVSILAIAYIKDETIQKFILIPYSALGLLFIVGFPFFIILLLTHRSNLLPVGRKIIWIIFGGIFIYVWYKNNADFTIIQNRIMIITLIAIIIMIAGDKKLHEMLRKK